MLPAYASLDICTFARILKEDEKSNPDNMCLGGQVDTVWVEWVAVLVVLLLDWRQEEDP